MRIRYELEVQTFTQPKGAKRAPDVATAERPRPAPREPKPPREFVDFDSVPGHQYDMHSRLLNWARASRDIPMTMQIKTAAGFGLYRSSDSRREYGAETVTVVDQRDAAKVAHGVVGLPEEKHRPAIQWYYLKRGKNPGGQAARLHLTPQGLADLVREARQLLIDRKV